MLYGFKVHSHLKGPKGPLQGLQFQCACLRA